MSVPASPPVQTYSTISQLFNTVNVVFKLTMHEQKEALIIRINLEVLSNSVTIGNPGDSYWWGGGYW